MHGGASPGRPITHGRYSVAHRKALAEKAQQFEAFVPDLAAELVLLRALLQDYLERYGDGVPLPAQAIESIYSMVEAIGRMEERAAKIRKDTAFGAQEMQLFIAAMSAVLRKYVPSNDLPDALNELRSLLAGN